MNKPQPFFILIVGIKSMTLANIFWLSRLWILLVQVDPTQTANSCSQSMRAGSEQSMVGSQGPINKISQVIPDVNPKAVATTWNTGLSNTGLRITGKLGCTESPDSRPCYFLIAHSPHTPISKSPLSFNSKVLVLGQYHYKVLFCSIKINKWIKIKIK